MFFFFLSVFWSFLGISDNFSSVWYVYQCFFINSCQTRHQQQKIIAPSDSLELSTCMWYKNIYNLLKIKEVLAILSCHILFSLFSLLIHMCKLIYMYYGQNKGKSLHSHTRWENSQPVRLQDIKCKSVIFIWSDRNLYFTRHYP